MPSTMTSYSFAISSMMGDSWRRDDAGEKDGRVKAVVVYVGRRRYESRRGPWTKLEWRGWLDGKWMGRGSGRGSSTGGDNSSLATRLLVLV